MKFVKSLSFLFCLSLSFQALAEIMNYQMSTYAVVKPTSISTSVSIGSGLVHKVHQTIGSQVAERTLLIEILEENTVRSYRSTIKGQVVKVHVTQGAAVSPGMPLVTVMNPDNKFLEIILSPSEARLVAKDSKVFDKSNAQLLGEIDFISSLVDPDNGGVVSQTHVAKLDERVGEVINVMIDVPKLTCSKIVNLDNFTSNEKSKVKVIYKDKVCLE